jgi:hypothetical protein
MIVGPLQFWPAARRRWPKAHRVLGRIYVGTILISMVGAAGYLLTTPPAKAFAGLPFHRALSAACVATTLSILAALYFIRKRDIAKHQVCMSLSFVFLLTAPLLRIDWTITGWLGHGATETELHQFVLCLLAPQCVLIAYSILCAIRAGQRVRAEPTSLPPWVHAALRWLPRALVVFAVPVALGVVVMLNHFFSPHSGLAGSLRYPETLLARESVVGAAAPILPAGAAILMGTAALLGLASVAELTGRRPFRLPGGRTFGDVFAIVFPAAALVSFVYGAALGLPNAGLVGGGSLFLRYGLVGAGLWAGFMAARGVRGTWLKSELTGFAAAMAVGVPLSFLRMWVSSSVESTADFYNTSIAGLVSLMPIAFFCVCYSRAAHEVRILNRPLPEPRDRRDEIIEAIVRVLLKSGLSDFSVREIGNKVGLRAPTLLHHFGDREGLLLAVFERVVRHEREHFSRIAEHSGSLTAAIRGLWEFHTRKTPPCMAHSRKPAKPALQGFARIA